MNHLVWIGIALLTALAAASQDAWIKRFFSHRSIYDMAVLPFFYGFPLMSATLLMVPVPPLDVWFFVAFVVSLPLNGICTLLYMKAIQRSPLSLTLPFLAFTPAFMLLTGFVVLGEFPNGWGMAGVILTTVGSYVLYIEGG